MTDSPAKNTVPDHQLVLVIGYGNPLRGDDGVGPYIAARLREALLPGVEVLAPQQLTLELAEWISRASLLILVDAAEGEPLGATACREVLPDSTQTQPLLHHMPAEALLAAVQALYGAAPPTVLWTINGAAFDVSEALSPEVQRAADALIPRILEQIEAGR